jgi:hypothetical protein
MNTNTETSSTYEQQRDEFEQAIRTLTTVPPTGYKWEAFRDQYIEQVEVYTGDDDAEYNRAWRITLAVAATALNDWNEAN